MARSIKKGPFVQEALLKNETGMNAGHGKKEMNT